MAQARLFVSHSHRDNAWCRPFADALKAVGYDVWYDETGLQGGVAWVANIQQEVEGREIFLLILTPEAWESKWVQDELQLAIATSRRVLPVLLRNTQVSGFLLTTQWITVIGEEPQAAARATIIAIEAPPAPGRAAAMQGTTETLDDLLLLCRSLATEGRYTEALSACARALALDPNNIVALTMKAFVLDKVGEPRLEAQTLFQALLIDPDNQYVQSNFTKIFSTLSDADALVQTYIKLRASKKAVDNAGNLYVGPTLEWRFLDGLKRLDRIDMSMEPISQAASNSVTRVFVVRQFREMKRDDLAVALVERWYGWPPKLSTVADIPTFRECAQALDGLKRSEDAKSIRASILEVFESEYSQVLWPGRVQGALVSGSYFRSKPYEEKEAFKAFLGVLEDLGRTSEANWLRNTYTL